METFVVRVWIPPESPKEADHRLCGVVEQVRTGDTSPFVGPDELLAFLKEASGGDGSHRGGGRGPM